ncbi:hypothetical protein ACFWZU_06710 [Frateuria sp. GZRR33]|uniref:hypothetical protein n=1 Tax=Frateuria sp. GZRR33 TaxID=3351535 RepID=UPI003EDBC800
MPNPKPTAQHRHGTGDRNDADVARMDHKLQEKRDAKETRDAKEADREAKREEGFVHP